MTKIDYDPIHSAMAALDAARHGAGISCGHPDVSDAFGGSYHPIHYSGVAGVVALHHALGLITEHAWRIIHGAAGRVRTERAQSYASAAWIVEYRHGAAWCVLDTSHGSPRGFASHRGAAIVAGRRGGRVRASLDLLGERVEQIHEQVRVAVRTLLAARAAYDALASAGAMSPYTSAASSIMAGHHDGRMHATGLRWLAGDREDSPVSVAAAQAFAAGGDVAIFAA